MDAITIQGGYKLQGEVSASGAKNAALPILFSSLLANGQHQFRNVPDLHDVHSTKLLLQSLSCRLQSPKKNFLTVDVHTSHTFEAPYDVVRKMRASILCLGPLLARYKKAKVSLPGGCAIGSRPINFHIEAFKQMGAQAHIEKGYIHAHVPKGLKGTRILFDNVTVGGTENIMMAATLAQGSTVLENAAKEPEVVDLAKYLISMGARITGHGTSVIRIEGVTQLQPTQAHTIIPDRIEAGTLLLAGAVTGGHIKVLNCCPAHLQALIDKLQESGFQIDIHGSSLQLHPASKWQAVDIRTAPYPGFATDLQAQFMALMTQSYGSSVITESVFENRFMHVQELVRLGADILPKTQVAVVRGPRPLQGAEVMATDLRASACLILGGLAAQGTTCVRRVYHLDRGYEALDKKLARLGAHIFRRPHATTPR